MSSLTIRTTLSPQLPPQHPMPPQAVVMRLQAGPTAAELQMARRLIAPFVHEGCARFRLAALLGNRDAALTLGCLQETYPSIATMREFDLVEYLFRAAIGNWLGHIMASDGPLVTQAGRMMVDCQPVRYLTRGYGPNNPALLFHYDGAWARALLHIHGKGTIFVNALGKPAQLDAGDVLLMSGLARHDVSPTLHRAPRTQSVRAFAVYDVSATLERDVRFHPILTSNTPAQSHNPPSGAGRLFRSRV